MGGDPVLQTTTPVQRALVVARDIEARASAHDRAASFPFENFADLHRAGLLQLAVPVAFGGPATSLAEMIEVVRIVGAADASTALVLVMHYLQLGSGLRSRRWPEAIRRRLAHDALEGVSLVNALRTEPELGTPARGGLAETVARRTEGGWRISGHKIYSTGAPLLGWGLVWARTEDETPRIGFWLVPMKAPGVSMVETWDHLGLRASGSHDTLFDNVFVPEDHAVDIRLPKEWAELDPFQAAFHPVALAALYEGVAVAARDWLVGYLKTRKPSNLGASLATLPHFQEAVGEIDAMSSVNRLLVDETAAKLDRDPASVTAEAAGLVKFTVTSNAIRIVERALQLTGNPGLSHARPLERYFRDVQCSRVHSPQNDSILRFAGRAALGL
ncbi:MAG: acyl-CoA/acyl-ACP dehydrogenase [Parvibaculaceae bacterium]|nr:acyl-CoA/acyl-ACP dehydrogenase [Parvibaculaceae bacterium]